MIFFNKDYPMKFPYHSVAIFGLTLLLVACGNNDKSPESEQTKPATSSNIAPVANAGRDQNATINTLVTLDASKSLDANNDSLTYSWSIVSKPENSSASLTNASTVNPTFVPDINGTYKITLIVNDGSLTNSDSVIIITKEPKATNITLPDSSTLKEVIIEQNINKTIDEYKLLFGVPADAVYIELNGYTTCKELGFTSGGIGGIFTDGVASCFERDKKDDRALSGSNHLLYYVLKDTNTSALPTTIPDLSNEAGIQIFKNLSEEEYQNKIDKSKRDQSTAINASTSCEEWGFSASDITEEKEAIPGLGGSQKSYRTSTLRSCLEVDYSGTTFYEGNKNIIIY